MTHEQQIKAVAEAIGEVLPDTWRHEPYDEICLITAQAAIAAMQVREMTVDEVAANLELVVPSWGTSELYAKALAKLGTIRIVEK